MQKALRDKKAICIFILPALIWFVVIAVLPVFQSFGYTFVKWNGITKAEFTGISNYIEVFQKSIFWKAALNSLLVALASVFIQLPISMLLALILNYGVRGETVYRTILFIPVVISSTIIAQLWMKIYHPNYGILNTLLKAAGLESWQQQWLSNYKIALVAVLIPMIWQYIGYHMLLFYSAAKSISSEITDAARIDGANRWQISFKIIIPLIAPMIETSVIFAVIGSLKSFDVVYMLTGGGPLDATQMPTLLMYTEAFSASKYGTASVMAIFVVVECLIFTLLIQKAFKRYRRE
ncbi:MAG: sugar ABC transporter permease [Eubacteriales bacterium]|nr:sugar ABC transporter permease [Eubacteriales bacterium]